MKAYPPPQPSPTSGEGELSHQFETMEQQAQASSLGIWVFLATEVLFFGGLFLLYTVYRLKFPEAFVECSKLMDLRLGAINTAILLTSSLTMALAVHAAEGGEKKATIRWLLFTMALGTLFLGIKGTDYYHKFVEHLVPGPAFQLDSIYHREAQIFFSLYFAMTGLHALHMIIGLGVLAVMVGMTWAGKFSKTYSNPIQIAGLYWHFIDIIWIFLFPLLYLIGARR
jgi:cytochrome c oxidase subunit III